MMRAAPYCLVVLVLLASGCGGGAGGGISQETATALVSNLDNVERGARSGECARTQPALLGLERRVRTLPSDVDDEVQSTLDQGVQNLGRLFKAECKQKRKPAPEPIAEPTFDTAPEPEVTEPEPEPEYEPPPEEPIAEEPEPEVTEEPQAEGPEEAKPEKPANEPDDENSPPKEEDLCGENPSPTC